MLLVLLHYYNIAWFFFGKASRGSRSSNFLTQLASVLLMVIVDYQIAPDQSVVRKSTRYPSGTPPHCNPFSSQVTRSFSLNTPPFHYYTVTHRRFPTYQAHIIVRFIGVHQAPASSIWSTTKWDITWPPSPIKKWSTVSSIELGWVT